MPGQLTTVRVPRLGAGAARHKALEAAEDAVAAIEKDKKHKAYLKVPLHCSTVKWVGLRIFCCDVLSACVAAAVHLTQLP